MEWNSYLQIGELAYDLYVRKNGAQSGMTLGVVAGCRAGVEMFDNPLKMRWRSMLLSKRKMGGASIC